jgi:hypothetical protein
LNSAIKTILATLYLLMTAATAVCACANPMHQAEAAMDSAVHVHMAMGVSHDATSKDCGKAQQLQAINDLDSNILAAWGEPQSVAISNALNVDVPDLPHEQLVYRLSWTDPPNPSPVALKTRLLI